MVYWQEIDFPHQKQFGNIKREKLESFKFSSKKSKKIRKIYFEKVKTAIIKTTIISESLQSQKFLRNFLRLSMCNI